MTKTRSGVEDDGGDDPDDDLLTCPACGASVHEDTQQCPACGRLGSRPSTPPSRGSDWFGRPPQSWRSPRFSSGPSADRAEPHRASSRIRYPRFTRTRVIDLDDRRGVDLARAGRDGACVAHSSTVAPVVRTSSMSSTRGLVQSGAPAHRKRALHVLEPCVVAQPALVRTCPDPPQNRYDRQSRSVCDELCELLGRVETAEEAHGASASEPGRWPRRSDARRPLRSHLRPTPPGSVPAPPVIRTCRIEGARPTYPAYSPARTEPRVGTLRSRQVRQRPETIEYGPTSAAHVGHALYDARSAWIAVLHAGQNGVCVETGARHAWQRGGYNRSTAAPANHPGDATKLGRRSK